MASLVFSKVTLLFRSVEVLARLALTAECALFWSDHKRIQGICFGEKFLAWQISGSPLMVYKVSLRAA